MSIKKMGWHKGSRSPHGLAGRMIRLPLRLIPEDAIIPVLSGVNRGRKWVAGASNTSKSWIGSYEKECAGAIQSLVKPGMVVYDIGANVGFYTLAFSRLVGDSGQVFAFEPEARNSYMIRQHLDLNQVKNVTLVQAAVSDRAGLVSFEGFNEIGKIVEESAYRVPAINLDEFIAIGNPPPAFVKMDIEGAECAALGGAQSILKKGEAQWVVATHSDQLRKDCRAVFAHHGYHFVSFDCVSDPGDQSDFLALPGVQ
jgi:FkbM family methyltransferase